MATSLTQSFSQIRLGGATTTTANGNRIQVGGVIGLNINDSGNFASSATLASTGSIVYNDIIGLSGQFTNASGQQATNLTQTGSTLWNLIQQLSGTDDSYLVHKTGTEFITGVKTFQSQLNVFGGFNSQIHFIGQANYTFATGDYVVIATGSNINVTGILPNSVLYSGVELLFKNNGTTPFQVSGVIDQDTNPIVNVYDSINVIAYSGQWTYLRQTGNANLIAAITSLSGYSAATYATIANLLSTGQALYNDIVGLSGQFTNASGQLQTNINTLTTNLALTGSNLYIDITGLSGQFNANMANFSTVIPTGSGALFITFPVAFASIPSVVNPSMLIYTGNSFGYGIWPSQITTSSYFALFSDTVLETGNYVVTYAHI